MTWQEWAMLGLTAVSAAGALIAGLAARRAEANTASANQIAKDATAVARKANAHASESNRIAQAARDDVKSVATDTAWDALIIAVAPLVSMDLVTETRLGPILHECRARVMVLVDRLDGWDEFGGWVGSEWQLGLGLGREWMETVDVQRLTVDEYLATTEDFHTWAAALTTNLRRFRLVGYDEKSARELRANAMRNTQAIYARNGWGLPPTTLPGVAPLGG